MIFEIYKKIIKSKKETAYKFNLFDLDRLSFEILR